MKPNAKTSNRFRLSPNEEAQFAREELERRRKLRLQQVREQDRYIALKVRHEVQGIKERELQDLAVTLRDDWQIQRRERVETMESLYERTLATVGQGQRSAKTSEVDLKVLAQKKEEDKERAAERHLQAIRELAYQRQAEAKQHSWHVEARKKALMVEKERATQIANLPQPPHNPIESMVIQQLSLPKMASLEHFSRTHYQSTETAVKAETYNEQTGFQQAEALEAQRIQHLYEQDASNKQDQLKKARLRGDHALWKEKVIQDRTKLLSELEQLQQADLQRRRRLVNSMPVHIFQPLYRQQELRTDQQRDMEIALLDLYTVEKGVNNDAVLQLVPEAQSALSTESHDEELDATLEVLTCEDTEGQEKERTAELEDNGQMALRTLMKNIRSQRSIGEGKKPPVVPHDFTMRSAGPNSNEGSTVPETVQHQWGLLESGMLQQEDHSLQDELEGKQPEQQLQGIRLRKSDLQESLQLPSEMCSLSEVSQQQEEIQEHFPERISSQENHSLQDELEEKQPEQQLQEIRLCKNNLQDSLQLPSEVSQQQEEIQEHLPEVKVLGSISADKHSEKLWMYQQKLLERNRFMKLAQDAHQRLEEYQQSLKLRYAVKSEKIPNTVLPFSR